MQYKREVLKYDFRDRHRITVRGNLMITDTETAGKEAGYMTSENKKILDRINDYAEVVLKDIDPQKTRISFQLEALKPVMQEIADEKGMSIEDVFILYMDLASEASVEAENQLQATLDDDEDANFSRIANRLN